ncbi:MAG TPA: NAD(P)H-dependent oxidoreductase [Candidatus Hydrogenedentes bacterium]|nr:NAD(P)H-dependent oxidoreductase [Candidatus Hydrogenedentota bacterium]HRK35313.1 NAD(P)H-dependent oxidoreductase [Candidatus Hydrogenedentota bacterium]
MALLVISCSLNPDSRSRVLARTAFLGIERLGVDADFVDLREYPMPLCDAGAAYRDPNAQKLSQTIAASDGVLVACPIYNYTVSSSLKNLIELTGESWRDKVVAIVCAAGGSASYMAHMGIANSLMLDYRCVIVPRFVHSDERDVTPDRIVSSEVQRRLDEVVALFMRMTRALNPLPDRVEPSA